MRGDVRRLKRDAARGRTSSAEWPDGRGPSDGVPSPTTEYRLRGAPRALRVWQRHRPAEPDLAHTSEGSRPVDSIDAVPGSRRRRFRVRARRRPDVRIAARPRSCDRLAVALAVAVVVAACGHAGAVAVRRRASAADARLGGAVAVRGRRRRRPPAPLGDRPARARLDAEHRPHRVLRRQAKGWYADAGDRPPDPARTATTDARDAAGRPPGRVRDQLPGLDDVRGRGRAPTSSVDGDPPAHGARRSASSRDGRSSGRATSTARRTPGFGYPNEEPTLKVVIKADGGKGEFKTATLDTAAYEALYAKRADFTITFTAWEGVEADAARDQAALLPVRRLRLPGLLPGRPRLRPPTGWRRSRTLAAGVRRRRRSAASSSPPTTPTRRPAILVAQNPGVFDANPTLPQASQRFLADGGYLVDATARSGRRRWSGGRATRLPVRPGPARRRRTASR